MNYQQSLRYLEQIQGLGIKFGLDNVRIVLSAFQNPHLSFPSVLVAGSNGKGSVCAMLNRILTLHDFRVGMYTSPHLVDYTERIRIGSSLISRAAFSRILTRLREKIEDLMNRRQLAAPPTHFELLTCLALLHFREQELDIAVLEVGMGGRFDATNVVSPILSIVTTISYEHQRSLGNSLREIAFEKAGIIRRGVPVVCGRMRPSAAETIRHRAQELKAPFVPVFPSEENFRPIKSGGRFCFELDFAGNTTCLQPSLAGEHQGINAAITVAACASLSQTWKPLREDSVLRGIASTRWEGRLEVIAEQPLVVLDGAHNEEGARALRDYVRTFLKAPVVLVFAVMGDKKIEELAEILFPLAGKVILTRFPYERAASPEEIAGKAAAFREKILMVTDPADALRTAQQAAGRSGTVVVCGSLFLVGEIKKLFPSPGRERKRPDRQ